MAFLKDSKKITAQTGKVFMGHPVEDNYFAFLAVNLQKVVVEDTKNSMPIFRTLSSFRGYCPFPVPLLRSLFLTSLVSCFGSTG